VKLAAFGVLVMPITVLVLTAIAVSVHAGRAGPLNAGPHGFSEILYTFTSVTNNNGSAFAGLSSNTAFYNIIETVGLLLGRFAIMVPVLALAGGPGRQGRRPSVARGRSAPTSRCSWGS
jgi:K+-transporting ATPase ATPase A chain